MNRKQWEWHLVIRGIGGLIIEWDTLLSIWRAYWHPLNVGFTVHLGYINVTLFRWM